MIPPGLSIGNFDIFLQNTKKALQPLQPQRLFYYGDRFRKRLRLCVQIGSLRQSLDDVYQELQQSGSIVTVDLAVLIVAVTVQSLLCVEVNCVC